jgi:hypothetical protein
VGEVIERIYQKNFGPSRIWQFSKLLSEVILCEDELDHWRASIPAPFQIIKSAQLVSSAASDRSLPFSLNLVLTLRYLNARILLHRAIIESFLRRKGNQEETEMTAVESFGKESLTISLSSSREMIELISEAQTQGLRILTTTWFMIYYGQYSLK